MAASCYGPDKEGTWRFSDALSDQRGSDGASGGRRHGSGRRRGGRMRRLRHVLRVLRPVQAGLRRRVLPRDRCLHVISKGQL